MDDTTIAGPDPTNRSRWVRRACLALVTLVLAASVWLGVKEGIDGQLHAGTTLQRIAATLQVLYGVMAAWTLWALWHRHGTLKRALGGWVIAMSATGALAPVAWGGTAWTVALLAGGSTLAVTGAVGWCVLRASRT